MNAAVKVAVPLLAVAGLVLSGCTSGTTPENTAAAGGLSEQDSAHLPADWPDVVAAAEEEGEVIIYTTFPEAQIALLIADFNTIYPNIRVQPVIDSSATLPARWSQEHEATGSSPGDLTHSAAFETMIVENPDWFVDLTEDADFLPSLNDFRAEAVPADRPLSVTVAGYTWQAIINTDLVSEADMPADYMDLTDAEWNGQLKFSDPRSNAFYSQVYFSANEAAGGGLLEGLAANNPSYTTDDITQPVAAGEFAIGWPTNAARAAALEAANAPVVRVTLQPALAGQTTMAVASDGPHPNAARVFANYLLTVQGQEKQCEVATLGSLNDLVGGPCNGLEIPEDATFLPLITTDQESAAVLNGLELN